METSKSEQTAYILWFSEFSNLIGESKISVHRNQRTVQSGHGDDRIKKIKEDAPKCVQQFPGIKVDNPTAEADCALTSLPPQLLTRGLGLHFSVLCTERGKRSNASCQCPSEAPPVSVSLSPRSATAVFQAMAASHLKYHLPLVFLLQIHLRTCLQSSF